MQCSNSKVALPGRYITKVIANSLSASDLLRCDSISPELIGSPEEGTKRKQSPTVPKRKRVSRRLSFTENQQGMSKVCAKIWMKFVLGLNGEAQKNELLRILLQTGVDITEASVITDACAPYNEPGSLKLLSCMALQEQANRSMPCLFQMYLNSTGNNEVYGGTDTKAKKSSS